MKVDIDWDTVEAVGIEYVKESYVALLETMQAVDYYQGTSRIDLDKDVERIKSFETVLKYILPEGEANGFIEGERYKAKQTNLFN
jgi:hypothetical protein